VTLEIQRRLLIDRISMLVVVGSQDLHKFLYAQFNYMFEYQSDFHPPGGKIKISKNKYTTRLDYYSEYTYEKPGRRKIADITLGATKISGQQKLYWYLTLTLYPSQFRTGEFQHFKYAFDKVFHEHPYSLLFNQGRVNYLELAADLLSHQNHSFLPHRKYFRDSRIWKEKDGYCGSTYLGSRISDQYIRIYDKKKQLLDTGKAPFTSVFPHTRIEAVMRRLGVAAADLCEIPNPFVKLLIADLAKAKAASTDNDWQAFLIECITEDGVPKALSKRPYNIRKQYRAMLDGLPVSWWQPQKRWKDMPKALEVIAP
jgi:hypothetical protein